MSIGRRLVAVGGVGVVWAVIWSAIGALLSIVVGIIDPPAIDVGEGPVDMAQILGPVGFVTGALFGALLAIVDGGRPIAATSPWRAALWGGVAGVVVGLIGGLNVGNTCPIGVIAGLVHVALARGSRRLVAAPVAEGQRARPSIS